MKKLFLVGLGTYLFATVSFADHSWSNYHWARVESPFGLVLVNSTTSDWDEYVNVAVSDWSQSAVLYFNQDPYGSTSKQVRRKCKAPTGQVRICNLAYGQNGWLGIAGISIDENRHIVSGYTKLNDTYFAWDYYNTTEWKQSVTCQELGHDIGLGHQDEDFDNPSLFSCMDYQDPPYEYPNAHDYEQLDTIYADVDSYDSYDAGGSDGGGDSGGDGCNAPPGKGCNKARPTNNGDVGWGMSLGRRGQQETFMRIDLDGTRHITFVTWAVGH